jgi:beta-aspartyl-dipeptidase (metallo-type)
MADDAFMLTLIQGADIYAPEPLGSKDVLVTGDKIGIIQKHIDIGKHIDVKLIGAKGKLLVPGFVDSHVHIIGGGGEGGFKTRTPEIMLSDITKAACPFSMNRAYSRDLK